MHAPDWPYAPSSNSCVYVSSLFGAQGPYPVQQEVAIEERKEP